MSKGGIDKRFFFFFKEGNKKEKNLQKIIYYLLGLDSRKIRKVREIPRGKVLSQAGRRPCYGMYPYIRQWTFLYFYVVEAEISCLAQEEVQGKMQLLSELHGLRGNSIKPGRSS